MMMKTKSPHQNKFLRIITMPIKALAKARDFYVRSMNNYADRVYYGPPPGSSYTADPFPRSLSATTARSSRETDDDFKELVRAASTSTLGNRLDLNSSQSQSQSSFQLLQQQKRSNSRSRVGLFTGVSRSASVGMAKIEEDKPIDDFDNETDDHRHHSSSTNNIKKKMTRFFPRSKSTTTTTVS